MGHGQVGKKIKIYKLKKDEKNMIDFHMSALILVHRKNEKKNSKWNIFEV